VSAWRHLRAIALLPGIVTVVVPAAILVVGPGPDVGWGLEGMAAAVPVLLGVALVTAGVALWAATARLLARVGRGTLAPWDPTSRLVVEGPYRFVRNPMITAVLAVLVGEAALFGSPALIVWSAVFLVANGVAFPLYEEPALERRFGDQYREYRRNVPRWIPRRTPWTLAAVPISHSAAADSRMVDDESRPATRE
jgi:protein-S-isoprenylcysteine O-methyltransferase Ste14